MKRTLEDELGRTWQVELEVPELVSAEEPGDTVLVFGREDEQEREILVIGPMEEAFEEVDDDNLLHALHATTNPGGILLVDPDLRLWWARGPEDDPTSDGSWAVKFSDGNQELTHEGPLRDAPETLTEDELLEFLDEARGRVMLPMDVTGGEEETEEE